MNFEIQCLDRYPQAEFMNILKHARVVITLGETKDSPTPIDTLACGTPIVMPRNQHKFLQEQFNDLSHPQQTGESSDEMLTIVSTENRAMHHILKSFSHPNPQPHLFNFHKTSTILKSFTQLMIDMQAKCYAENGIILPSVYMRPGIFR